MPMYDYRCPAGHVHEALVPYEERKAHQCPECGNMADQVWLTCPELDWSGMAQGPNAGPEFVDRFERSHKKRREQEEAHRKEHGDSLRGAGS